MKEGLISCDLGHKGITGMDEGDMHGLKLYNKIATWFVLLRFLIIMEISVKTAEQLRLTGEEFELIKKKLGRIPNFTELCAFSAMWSEHCSYKNSIKWLKTLPREGKKMLVKAGEENAGLMDIGDGFGVVFKIESHNDTSDI